MGPAAAHHQNRRFYRVLSRGQTPGFKKDFFDLVEILQRFEPASLRRLLEKKFGPKRVNTYHLLKSLLFFDDAEQSADPESLNGRSWEQVRRYLLDREPELREAFLK